MVLAQQDSVITVVCKRRAPDEPVARLVLTGPIPFASTLCMHQRSLNAEQPNEVFVAVMRKQSLLAVIDHYVRSAAQAPSNNLYCFLAGFEAVDHETKYGIER